MIGHTITTIPQKIKTWSPAVYPGVSMIKNIVDNNRENSSFRESMALTYCTVCWCCRVVSWNAFYFENIYFCSCGNPSQHWRGKYPVAMQLDSGKNRRRWLPYCGDYVVYMITRELVHCMALPFLNLILPIRQCSDADPLPGP